MDGVLRAAAIYLFLLVVFRLTGRRTMGQLSSFDFVLLLILGEATQQALLGSDFSVTQGVVVITTLLVLDIVLGVLKHRFAAVDRLVDGVPVQLMRDGALVREHLDRERLDAHDLLTAARRQEGVPSLDRISEAIMEPDGRITVVPRSKMGKGSG